MRTRIPAWMMAAAVLAIAAPAWAGGEKCSAANAQECLSHYSGMRTKGWVGLDLDKTNKEAMVVTSVVAGSPAEKAGFKSGDMLVALNGVNLSDKEAAKAAKGAWTPGSKVTYTVKRGTSEKKLEVTLAKMPEDVLARMVGAHMIEEHMAALDAASVDSKD